MNNVYDMLDVFDFDPIQMSEKSKDDAKKMASMYNKCFTTKEGKAVMRDLITRYVLNAMPNSQDTAISIGIREGRALLVKEILQQIQIAKGMTND